MLYASPATRRALERARALPPQISRLAREGAGRRPRLLWPPVALSYALLLVLFVIVLPVASGPGLAAERAINYLCLAAMVAAGARDYRERRRRGEGKR